MERKFSEVRPDATQLKALAHPVRLRMLALLRLDGSATATQLAQRLSLNSGATSYHLRQLEQHGFIEEDADRGSKRDRWWRATHLATRREANPESEALDAEEGFLRAAHTTMIGFLNDAVAERQELPPEWLQASGDNDWVIRMTAPEAARLISRIESVITEALAEEPELGEEEPGSEQYMIMLYGFPRPGTVVHQQDR